MAPDRTALVAAALSIPGFYVAWFQFDRLAYSSVLLVLLFVSLPLVARRVALLARDFGL